MIKQQLRLTYVTNEEAAELVRFGNSAERTLLKYCNRTYEELCEMEGGEFPIDLVHAALLLVDSSYNHRSPTEQVNVSPVPYGTFDFKVKPYMKL